jgi:hypothetical protein
MIASSSCWRQEFNIYDVLLLASYLSAELIYVLVSILQLAHQRSNKPSAASHQIFHACKIELTLLKPSPRAQNPAPTSIRPAALAGRVCLSCVGNGKNEVASGAYRR